MESENSRSAILSAAIQIGEDLLQKKKSDSNGVFWETMGVDGDGKVVWTVKETLYNGVSGIALFLLNLGRISKQDVYFQAAELAMQWTYHYCKSHRTGNYALITGRLGVSYALAQFYLVTGKEYYREQAEEIARDCDLFLKSPLLVNDLINGISGTILGLLFLHSICPQDWIVERIGQFLEALLNNAHVNIRGELSWDRSEKQISCLCGYSHGAAGIGTVLLECGTFFENRSLDQLAEWTFQYETSWFDEQTQNWPDLRKFIKPEEMETRIQAFLANDLDFFSRTQDMNAWCHGAAGIGHSRLKAYRKLGKKKYFDDFRTAIRKVEATDLKHFAGRSFSLCHGIGGNAELFIEGYLQTGDLQYLRQAELVAGKAFEAKQNKGYYISGVPRTGEVEDLSLFLGNAGIGYFLLRVLDPENVPSILSLSIPERKNHIQGWSGRAGLERVFALAFPRTATEIRKSRDAELQKVIEDPLEFKVENGLEWAVSSIRELSRQKGLMRIEDILDLEFETLKLEDDIGNNVLLWMSDSVGLERGEQLAMDLTNETLTLNSFCRIHTTRWDWQNSSEVVTKPQTFQVLLKPTAKAVQEFWLDSFCHSILQLCSQEGITFQNLVREMLNLFGDLDQTEKAKAEILVRQQVNQLLKANILQG